MALANAGSEAEPVEQSSHPEIEQHSTKVLMLGALGVVYGDIGTSPIYAFREALMASSGGNVADRGDILGVLSLIIWSLTIIVTIKYIDVRAARRQPRRGRHAVADGAGARQFPEARRRSSWASASSARRCFSATRSSRRRFRCCRRSRA